MGRVDIGKFGRGRMPTTTAAAGVTDEAADRKTTLGNVFTMRMSKGTDQALRGLVVDASAMMLRELEDGGRCDVRRIAWEGPGGRGWWVRGKRVALGVDEKMMRNDPSGAHRWDAVQRMGGRVARGENIRLLCHCRASEEMSNWAA